MKDTVEIKISHQGNVKLFSNAPSGYMLKRGENVAAFYLDAYDRAYCNSTCRSVTMTNENLPYPSMWIDNGYEEPEDFSEIYFPEYEGWHVHSVSGGKTLSICLVKD